MKKTLHQKAAHALKAFYEKVGGDTMKIIDFNSLCSELGYSKTDIDQVWFFCTQNGYINGMGRRQASLTVEGIEFFEEMEQPLTPQQPTVFGPYINISNSQVSGSNIATQGTANVHYSVEHLYRQIEENGGHDKEALKQIVQEILQQLEQENLPKGAFSKYADLIAKHAWISQPLSQLLFQLLMRFVGLPV